MSQSVLTAILVTLNLALQIFDGFATYSGWQQWGEGNPLLRAGFETAGAGPTLVATKLGACLLVLFLMRAADRMIVKVGLSLTIAAYTAFSLVPWSYCLIN